MSKKTLVFSPRPKKLSAAIAAYIQAAGSLITPVVTTVGADGSKIKAILAEHRPEIVVIDGNFGEHDETLWVYLQGQNQEQLRLELLTASARKQPVSLQILRLVHAFKSNNTSVVIFIDKPTDLVVTELKRVGASTVFKELNSISEATKATFDVIDGSKKVVAGIATLGRKVGARISAQVEKAGRR